MSVQNVGENVAAIASLAGNPDNANALFDYLTQLKLKVRPHPPPPPRPDRRPHLSQRQRHAAQTPAPKEWTAPANLPPSG